MKFAPLNSCLIIFLSSLILGTSLAQPSHVPPGKVKFAHITQRTNLERDPIRHDVLARASDAATVFREIMDAPDQGIPQALLERAACVAVFPSVKKAGFVVGGQWGRGVVSCRNESNSWSTPAFFNISGGSFGLQIGAQVVDLVLIILNQSGMNGLLQNKFEIGAGASATAGLVGRNTAISTDALFGARIISYSRSRGLFAGLELKGSVLTPDTKANQAIYGEGVHTHELLSSVRMRGALDVMVYPRALYEISPYKVYYVKVPSSRRRILPPYSTAPSELSVGAKAATTGSSTNAQK